MFWNKTNLFNTERPNQLRKHTFMFMLNSMKRFKNLTTGVYKYWVQTMDHNHDFKLISTLLSKQLCMFKMWYIGKNLCQHGPYVWCHKVRKSDASPTPFSFVYIGINNILLINVGLTYNRLNLLSCFNVDSTGDFFLCLIINCGFTHW